MTAADSAARGPARWRHLGVSLVGLVAACAIQNGLPFLTVALRAVALSLAALGLLVSVPTAGLALSLLAWGAAAGAVAAALAVGVVPGRAVEVSSWGAPRAADPVLSR